MKLSDAILRLGLIAAGLILINLGADLWAQTTFTTSPIFGLTLSFTVWFLGSALFVLALLSTVNPRWVWFIIIAFLLVQLGYAYLAGLNSAPLTTSHTDNEMIGEYAAQALKQGQNPYQWNYSDILSVYRDRGLLVTPWLDGSGQSRLTYPALPTLLLWGLEPFGLSHLRSLSLIFHLLLLALVFVGAPITLRPIILLPLFLLKPFVTLSLNGVQDIVWSALLVGMLLAWRRPVWRAILFGLACTFRQQPWFVAPFLLIYLWHETGERRRLVQFIAISLGVFLALNLPFMLWDFRAWVLGVFEPLYAQFNIYSQGLAIISQIDFLPLPRYFYTFLQTSALALMIFSHWRHRPWIGQAFWLFPGIFFWFYYRGLSSYWLYWVPPLLVAVSRQLFDSPLVKETSLPWRRTIDITIVVLAANLFIAAAFSWFTPAIEVELFLPMETVYGNQPLVARLKVTVLNHSASMMRPRFAVQGDSGVQPLPWRIDLGPEQLAPGETGDYVISTGTAGRPFPASRGGLVVVNDANGDYGLRTTYTIAADPSFLNPDQIANPQFYFWGNGTNAPESWRLLLPANSSGLAMVQSTTDREALLMSAQTESGPISARLSQTITFPGPFAIWVHPPPVGAYGLEFNDGTHTLQIFFGEAEGRETISETQVVVYQRAPLEAWSQQTIDLPKLYAEAGWPLPTFSIRKRNGVEYAARQIEMSLSIASTQNTASGWFGSIEQAGVDPVSEALAHPDTYYTYLGDEYRRQRNGDLAETAYQQALGYNANSAEAYNGLGWVWLARQSCAEAEGYFKQALTFNQALRESQDGLAQCSNP